MAANERSPIWSNLGIILSLAAGTIVALRLTAISNFNYETAVAILSLQGTGSIVLGSLLFIAYFLPFLGVLAVSIHAQTTRPGQTTLSGDYRWPFLLLVTATVIVSPVLLGLITLLFVSYPYRSKLYARLRRRSNHPAAAEPWSTVTPRLRDTPGSLGAVIAGVVVALIFLVWVLPPWMPAERVSFNRPSAVGETSRDTRSTITAGYVLEADGDELVLLQFSPEPHVVRLTSESGFTRSYCNPNRQPRLSKPLITLVLGDADYADCPTGSEGRVTE